MTFKVGKTYLTECGYSARVIDNDGKKLTGIVTDPTGHEQAYRWGLDGKSQHPFHSESFMFLVGQGPVAKTVWVNVYKNNQVPQQDIKLSAWSNKELAVKHQGNGTEFVGTFPFTFEVEDNE